jgi:AcrR family transcriptional regulator
MPSSVRLPLRREAIVAAARDLISSDGLEAVSLRRLAGLLGVTAPALYAHVADKEDLLRHVAEAEFDLLVERFEAIDEPDPLVRIRAHNRAYVAHARERPELFRVMFLFPPNLDGFSSPPPGVELPGATRAFNAAATAVAEAIDSGAIDPVNPMMAAITIWSAVHGVASVLQLGFALPRDVEDALVDEVSDRLLAGYGAHP